MFDYQKFLEAFNLNNNINEDVVKNYLKELYNQSQKYLDLIKNQIKVTTGIDIPTDQNKALETAMASLGSSIGMLQNISQFTNSPQAKQIEEFCRKQLKDCFHLNEDQINDMNQTLTKYIQAYKDSFNQNSLNPFSKSAEMLMTNLIDEQIKKNFTNAFSFNPILQQLISNQLALMSMQQMQMFNFNKS